MDKKREFRNGKVVDVYYDENGEEILLLTIVNDLELTCSAQDSEKFRTIPVAKN